MSNLYRLDTLSHSAQVENIPMRINDTIPLLPMSSQEPCPDTHEGIHSICPDILSYPQGYPAH